MDLVKARQRAKKKADQKETERAGKAPAAPESAVVTPSPPAAPAAPPAVEAPVAAEPDDDYPLRPVTRQPPPASVEDVFMDTAFGEDLPPLALDEELNDDGLLGEAATAPEPSPPPPPKARPAAKPSAPLRPAAGRKPAPVEPEDMVAIPPPAVRPEVNPAPLALAGGRKGPVRPLWQETETDFMLGSAKAEDDFLELVSEELYLREFGRQEEDVSQQLELLSFRLAREVYAVRLTSIKQIIKLTPITTVPRAPGYVLGIISLRGTIIPVFDLRRRLALPQAEATRKSRIVVVSAGRFTVGLIVDEVEQVARIPAEGLEPPPSVLAGVEAEFIEGIGRTADKMIILLALDKILTPVLAGTHGLKAGA